VPQLGHQKSNRKAASDDELNPLVNPLLAANMGRWAEVYFTTLPENRAQAIHELLRELANPSPSQPVSRQDADREKADDNEETISASETSEGLTCSACAHKNRAGQKFCVMCGVALPASSERFDSSDKKEEHVPGSAPINLPFADLPLHSKCFDPAVALNPPPRESGEVDRPAGRIYFNDLPSFATEPESVPYRYRRYVGVGLAVVIAGLVSMAWRGTNARSGARHAVLSQAVPSEQPLPSNSAAEPTATPSAPTSTPVSASKASVQPAPATQDQPLASFDSKRKRHAAARPTGRVVPVSATSAFSATGQSGAEELAVAEKFMKANAGEARDSGEAAAWLWKAVGKGNVAATVALADLYLHGDGVSKNCDQGRLLLDAAARKGGKPAAVRLRNLQAFGCQ
jgi:hypothetical protein